MGAAKVSRTAAGTLVLVAVSLIASRASGEGSLRLSVDWSKLAEVLRDGTALLPESQDAVPDRPRRSLESDGRWFGGSPRASLVARDWSGAQRLLGDLTLTDQVRLSRSCRMVLSRLRMSDGLVTPFAQAGLGQWRVDTDLVPALRGDLRLAGQLGGGFELRLRADALLAVEADYTMLYREANETSSVPWPHVWTTFLATRVAF